MAGEAVVGLGVLLAVDEMGEYGELLGVQLLELLAFYGLEVADICEVVHHCQGFSLGDEWQVQGLISSLFAGVFGGCPAAVPLSLLNCRVLN